MLIPKLPCKIHKCITRPICKNKQTVDCYYLTEYLSKISPYLNFNITFHYLLFKTGIINVTIKRFKKQFPNLLRVQSELIDNYFIFSDLMYKNTQSPITYKKGELSNTELNLLMKYIQELHNNKPTYNTNNSSLQQMTNKLNTETTILKLINKCGFNSEGIKQQLINLYLSIRK